MLEAVPNPKRSRAINASLRRSQLAQATRPEALLRLLRGAPTPLYHLLAVSVISTEGVDSPELLCKSLLDTPLRALVMQIRHTALETSALPAGFVRSCCKRLHPLLKQKVGQVDPDGHLTLRHSPVRRKPLGHTTLRELATLRVEAVMSHWQDALCAALHISRARAAQPEAFAALIEPCLTQVRQYLQAHVREASEAQDMEQELWLLIWKKMPTYEPFRGSFPAFVFYWAKVIRKRYLADLLRYRTGMEKARRCTRFLHPASETLLLPVLYDELLRLTFCGDSPPHQVICFAFCKLLYWRPRQVVANLSQTPLSALGATLEALYLDAVQPPADRLPRLRAYFTPLHQAMQRPLQTVLVDAKTRQIHHALLDRLTGRTALRDYYRDHTDLRKSAADVASWWYAVQRRIIGRL